MGNMDAAIICFKESLRVLEAIILEINHKNAKKYST